MVTIIISSRSDRGITYVESTHTLTFTRSRMTDNEEMDLPVYQLKKPNYWDTENILNAIVNWIEDGDVPGIAKRVETPLVEAPTGGWTFNRNAEGNLEAHDGTRVRAIIEKKTGYGRQPWLVRRVEWRRGRPVEGIGFVTFPTLRAAKSFCSENPGVWGV